MLASFLLCPRLFLPSPILKQDVFMTLESINHTQSPGISFSSKSTVCLCNMLVYFSIYHLVVTFINRYGPIAIYFIVLGSRLYSLYVFPV